MEPVQHIIFRKCQVKMALFVTDAVRQTWAFRWSMVLPVLTYGR